MEWCSEFNARKKLKKNQVSQKSLLNIFIEYAWDYRDGACFGCEDVELISWLKSANLDVNSEKWFHSIKLDVRVGLRIDSTDEIKSNENLYRRAQESNNAIKCANLAYNLRKVLAFLINCNDNINYIDNGGRTILHVFLEEHLKSFEDSISIDQIFRLQQLVKNLVERGASFYVYDKNQKTPLCIAVKFENIEVLKIIVSTLTNINARDEQGNTVLHIVVDNCIDESRYIDIVQTLVLKGADVNEKNNKGVTPVHLVARKFYAEMLKFFGDNGANFQQRANDGETLLHFACKSQLQLKDSSKMVESMYYLVDQGCDLVAVDKEGYMPLHYAAEYGTSQIIEFLIELGANVDCRNEKTWITPLFLASKADRLDNIRALIQAGADVNAEAVDGSTPIFIAALLASVESFRYLIDQGADLYRRDKIRGYTLLHLTAYVVDTKPNMADDIGISLEVLTDDRAAKAEMKQKKFDIIVNEDFNVNDSSNCSVTPLHLATITENLDIVKILIERGANVNFQSDVDELTALHIATIYDNFEIVRILIEAGADINCKGGIDQVTPLHLALTKDIDWKLGKYGVAKSDRANSILHKLWPCRKSKESKSSKALNGVALMLIEYGADIYAKDACRRTPLHLATLRPNMKVMRSLLKSDAQINVQDAEGRLPLHNILENGSVKGLELLLDYGADINDIDISELIINGKGDFKTLVIKHAIKLKLIGLPIAKIYEQFISAPEFVAFHNLCSAEAKSLANYWHDGFSFYQFLHTNVKLQYYSIEKISGSFDTLTEPFPIYSNIIRAACREAAYRKPLLESARKAWTGVSTVHLPDVCVEHVFSHLNNRYLEVFASIASNDVKSISKNDDYVMQGSNYRSYKRT